MPSVVVSTSSSCLNLLNIKHDIRILPLHIAINGVDFVDGKNITPSKLAEIMDNSSSSIAMTSPATELEVMAFFLDLYDQGYNEVFVCSLSSQFSQSYKILCTVKQQLADKMLIFIYDTKTLNLHEGALAYEADYLLKQGKNFAEVVIQLDLLRQNSVFYFTLYNLDYIIRSKRLSAPSGFFANLFDIKPIMEINQMGQIVAKQKIRKMDKVLSQLGKDILQFTKNDDAFIYLSPGGYQSDVDYFAEVLARECGLINLPVIPVSSISLANHGPRGVAIGAFVGQVPQIAKLFK